MLIIYGNECVRYKPRVPGKPSTSHKNVGFPDLNTQQIHTAQKNKFIAKQGKKESACVLLRFLKIKKGTSKKKIKFRKQGVMKAIIHL